MFEITYTDEYLGLKNENKIPILPKKIKKVEFKKLTEFMKVKYSSTSVYDEWRKMKDKHATLHCSNSLAEESIPQKSIPTFILKFSTKDKRKILKAFLLGRLHQLFCELFQSKMQCNQNNFLMECYAMDGKIIQFLIQGIVETGEYTLEGIAFYTRIPFDVIYEAACGISNQFSITPWARVVNLYIQVNPDIEQTLIDQLIEVRNKKLAALSLLLTEE